MEITATIKNARWSGNCIAGEIHGDTEKRWEDGHRIRTSLVKEKLGGGIYRTLNSVYKVEFASDEPSRDSAEKV